MVQLQGVQHLLAGGEIQMAEALLQLEDLQAVAALDDGAGTLVKRRFSGLSLARISYWLLRIRRSVWLMFMGCLAGK